MVRLSGTSNGRSRKIGPDFKLTHYQLLEQLDKDFDEKCIAAAITAERERAKRELAQADLRHLAAVDTLKQVKDAEIAALKDSLEESVKRNHQLLCSYCGQVDTRTGNFEKDRVTIAAHIENCPTHPIYALFEVIQERDTLKLDANRRVAEARLDEAEWWEHRIEEQHLRPKRYPMSEELSDCYDRLAALRCEAGE